MFLSLVSGSSGNASIISDNKTTILIDCGLSGKKLISMLDSINIDIKSINALLLTHEHCDHTKGASIVSRKYNIPIYATKGTFDELDLKNIKDENINIIDKKIDFSIGDIRVNPFSISHDAADPLCYSFYMNNKKYSIATDTGIMSDEIFNSIKDSDYCMLEANHDTDILMYGEYPFLLKQRIMSDKGHLSNNAAADTAIKLLENGTKNIMLSHLSDKNNTPHIAYKTVENALVNKGAKIGKDINLFVAKRYEVTKFI